MPKPVCSDILVAGGGLAGIITALEALRAGKTVTIVDRDTPQRFGGLALWAFGGMALIGTALQRRMKIPDSAELALQDWLRFGELDPLDKWPMQWARYYVEHSQAEVYDWLIREGMKFLPSVNWVERGRFGDGNSVPRYHIIWGTSRELVRCMVRALHDASSGGRLTIHHNHRITGLDQQAGKVHGAVAVNEVTGREERFEAPIVVLAMGGLNSGHDECRANWPVERPQPTAMLNGAHPLSDGKLHRWTKDNLGACITHAGEMWNYAAGFPHPFPHFPGHGLSSIPCKSALWLNHRGERIGPEPLVTGFDTHWLCQQVAAQEKPWTWHLLNRRIALKEFAISGAEHNARIRDKQFPLLLKEVLLGNTPLVDQMQNESNHFLVDNTLLGLAKKMNALTCSQDVDPAELKATADAFDANFSKGDQLNNDPQIRLIRHARQWGPDRLRTCKPAPLQKAGAGPFIAIHTQLTTRKSLGGLQTDLQSRVLDANGQSISGLYCVGEAAGFGGGGCNGKRSLEGTFLPGCIMTAKAAARSINAGN
ncbi:FAD-dependent oxidoreductase [Microbulbifer sp. 2304DJ12-6]|uniref:FAD-dependent oxidoreductase n=1 Tax=Microbulbifer sp. 2304DJ12-6 TaxID=3233340 RepID=UPI0039AF0431